MAGITKDNIEKIVNLILEEGLSSRKSLEQAIAHAQKNKISILASLLELNVVSDDIISHATAKVIDAPYVSLRGVRMDQETLLLIPRDVAEKSEIVAIGEHNGQLVVAMSDISNVQLIDFLSTFSKKSIKSVMASPSGIRYALSQYRGDFSSVAKAVSSTNAEAEQQKVSSNVKTITQDSPISKALTTILDYAAKSKASDIHIEPLEESLVIRCRIDGVLRKTMELPKSIEPALVSRIKILANLKIDEHRIPQDGQFAVLVAGREIDLRIATSPVIWGEQVVIRLLDKSGTSMDIEKMGMTGRSLRHVLSGIAKPNGMILTSGPTGSGKSTTLYALIKKIKSEKINIVTLEDPVEYKMDGINQIQVNVDAGLTFASGLRSILRQDPDAVMVGEIRDAETASLAVQAALTGHLVFSTLHTNSAAGILPRLIDMGIEPFLIASTLNTVIGQRLVRRVTEKRDNYASSAIETAEINQNIGHLLPTSEEQRESVSQDLGYKNLPVKNESGYTLVRGIQSNDNPNGYSGRAGLYETIDVDEDIQKLIVSHSTAGDIMRLAKEKGTVTMREDGMLKAISGITTIEEVNRVASDIV